MDHNWRELALLTELNRQCRFAIQAWEDLSLALALSGDDRIWYSLQGFAVALANISKILWPARRTGKDRRRPLRESLGIEDSSPLRVRTLRNHFEHLDERIEQWADEYRGGSYSDYRMVLPGTGSIVSVTVKAGDQVISTMGPRDILWIYSLAEQALYFRGVRYDLAPYVDEVRRLLSAVDAAIDEC